MFFGGCARASTPGLGRAQGTQCLLRDASSDHTLWDCYSSTPQLPPRQYQNQEITGVFVWVLAGYSHCWRGVHGREFGFVQAVSAADMSQTWEGHSRYATPLQMKSPDSWEKPAVLWPALCWRNHTARLPVIEKRSVWGVKVAWILCLHVPFKPFWCQERVVLILLQGGRPRGAAPG